jgi:hypothetical protein
VFAVGGAGHPDAMPGQRRGDGPPGTTEFFPFAPASGPLSSVLRLLRLPRRDDGVRFDGSVLDVRFRLWRVTTTAANIASVEVTGPFAAWKVLGARLSLADRGLTFGTVSTAGVCIAFRDPVSGIEPTGLLRHPNLTVTVDHPGQLAERLRQAI